MNTRNSHTDALKGQDTDTIKVHLLGRRLLPSVARVIPAAAVTLYVLHVIRFLPTLMFFRAEIALFYFAFALFLDAASEDDGEAMTMPLWLSSLFAAPAGMHFAVTSWQVSSGNAVFTSELGLAAYYLLGFLLLSVVAFYVFVFARMACRRLAALPLVRMAPQLPSRSHNRQSDESTIERSHHV